MFDAVARRYDITNTVLSLGQDRFWRRATRKALDIGPGDRVLDLAAGTHARPREHCKVGLRRALVTRPTGPAACTTWQPSRSRKSTGPFSIMRNPTKRERGPRAWKRNSGSRPWN